MVQSDDPASSRERVDKALDTLRRVLLDYRHPQQPTSSATRHAWDLQALLNWLIGIVNERRLIDNVIWKNRVRTVAHGAKEARNAIAHYDGTMTPHDALRHLANVRQLVKELGRGSAFQDVDHIYWEHVRGLHGEDATSPQNALPPLASPAKAGRAVPAEPLSNRSARGTYEPLRRRLLDLAEGAWQTTFQDVEGVLGRSLPNSARKHQAWWSNTKTHSHAEAWLGAGWRTRDVDVAAETVTFARIRAAETDDAPAADAGLLFFDGDDASYLRWVASNPGGYVVNVRRRLTPDYVVLHRASCPHVSAPAAPGAYTERGYRKYCGDTLADVREAPVRCGRPSGSFTKRCSLCSP